MNNLAVIKDYILSALFVLAACLIPLHDFGCTFNQVMCVVMIASSMLSGLRFCMLQFAFILPFMSATAFPIFGIDFHVTGILELLIMARVIAGQGKAVNRSLLIGLAIAGVASQVPSMFVYEQSFGNMIRFVINICLLYISFSLVRTRYCKANDLLLALSIGVFVSCILGFWYHPPLEQLQIYGLFDISQGWMRYRGLWTDPNFLSMFCLIGICVCVSCPTDNMLSRIVLYTMAGLFCFFGSLTMSRMFIASFILLIAIYACQSMRQSVWARFGIVVLALLAIPFVADVFNTISINRVSTEGGLANGRVDRTMALLKEFSIKPFAVFLGIGYINEDALEGLKAGFNTSHNTYADILIQFGVVGLTVLVVLIKLAAGKVMGLLKHTFRREALYFLPVIVCSAGLSILKYEFLYFMIGIFFADYVLARDTEYYEISE